MRCERNPKNPRRGNQGVRSVDISSVSLPGIHWILWIPLYSHHRPRFRPPWLSPLHRAYVREEQRGDARGVLAVGPVLR